MRVVTCLLKPEDRAHRAMHEINIIWATHQVHHSGEDFNLALGMRQGLFQRYFTWPCYLPMAILGVPTEFFITHQGLLLETFEPELKRIRSKPPVPVLDSHWASWRSWTIFQLLHECTKGWVFDTGELTTSNCTCQRWKIHQKHHQVHHGRNPYCIDKNYGGVLIIWDRVFGTFADRDDDVHYEGEKIAYGVVS